MSFIRSVKRFFGGGGGGGGAGGPTTENAANTGDNKPLVSEEPAESNSFVMRKLKSIGNAIKMPFVKLDNWRRGISNSDNTSSCSSDTVSEQIELSDRNAIVNRYRIRKERAYIKLNGWRVYDAVEMDNEKKKIEYGRHNCKVNETDKIYGIQQYKRSILIYKKETGRVNDFGKVDSNKCKHSVLLGEELSSSLLAQLYGFVETPTTLVFATESIYCNLENIFQYERHVQSEHERPKPKFDELDKIYGIQQIIDGLMFLHYNKKIIHHNLTPRNIVITERGVWKLFGLELAKEIVLKRNNHNITDTPVDVMQWSIKIDLQLQPHLDYIAPEIIIRRQCYTSSDIFSLGLIICALYNNGKPLIETEDNPIAYLKQLQDLENEFQKITQFPKRLRPIVELMVKRDYTLRPTTQSLARPCFDSSKDFALTMSEHRQTIKVLQCTEDLARKTIDDKQDFYEVQLMKALPHISENLLLSLVWPTLRVEMFKPHPLISILKPLSYISQKFNNKHFKRYMISIIKRLVTETSSNSSIFFIEHLDEFITETHYNVIVKYLMPFLYTSLDSDDQRMKRSSVIAIISLSECIKHDPSLTDTVLSKLHDTLNTSCDLETVILIFKFYESMITSLDETTIIETIVVDLMLYTSKYPIIFHHGVLSNSMSLSQATSHQAYNMLMDQTNLQTIEKTMSSKDFHLFYKNLRGFVTYLQRSETIIVRLINQTPDPLLYDSPKPRRGSNSSFSEWIWLKRDERRAGTSSSAAYSAGPSTSDSKKHQRVPDKYVHTFLRDFAHGTYIDENGIKKKLPSWSILKVPQANISDYSGITMWAKSMYSIIMPSNSTVSDV